MRDMAATPALTSKTKADAVADELRRLIRTGEIPGGAHLRQADIARQFGVSTTPVREAFTMLGRERLLSLDSHRGAFVFSLDRDAVIENFEIRAALEQLAAELAVERITESELEELDALLLEMERDIKQDPEYFTTVLNPKFHGLVNAAAHRPRLDEMILDLRGQAMSYQALLVTLPGQNDDYADQVHAEHVAIVQALREKSVDKVRQAVRAHIHHGLSQVLLRMPDDSISEPDRG